MNPAMIVGGVVAIGAVVMVAVMMNRSGGSDANAAGSGDAASERSEPIEAAPAQKPAAADKAGKTPDRAAPSIPDDVWDRMNRLYSQAKKKHDEGVRARSVGETKQYTALIKEAFAHLEELNTVVEPHTDWLEEAVLEGWAMPGEYVSLEKKLGTIDRLMSRVQKLKPR